MRIIFRSFIFLMPLLCLITCKEAATSTTDVVTITSINAFITNHDLYNGILKTKASTERVKISHEKHAVAGIACTECHHKHGNDERIKTCAFCHKGRTGAKVVHETCLGCHAKLDRGARSCSECHVDKKKEIYEDIKKIYMNTFKFTQETHRAHAAADISCEKCHHDAIVDKSAPKRKCSECHTGRSNTLILHYFCKDCHSSGRGPVRCQGCHAGVKSVYQNGHDIIPIEKTGHRLPQINFNHRAHIESYDTECIDCHHLGSTKKCSHCHTNKDDGAVINIRGAYHQQCHECHRKTKGPKGCMKCHRENHDANQSGE